MTEEGRLKKAICELINMVPIGALLFVYGFLLEYSRS